DFQRDLSRQSWTRTGERDDADRKLAVRRHRAVSEFCSIGRERRTLVPALPVGPGVVSTRKEDWSVALADDVHVAPMQPVDIEAASDWNSRVCDPGAIADGQRLVATRVGRTNGRH